MNKLILNKNYQLYEQNGKVFCSSLQVAKVFEKRHDHILRDINTLITDMPSELGLPKFGESNLEKSKFGQLNFEESFYKNEQNKKQPMYLLTKDGFTLLAMGFKGKKALKFKIAYINRFNEMENFIKTKLSGLNAKDFANFKLLDKEHQKEAMQRLHKRLSEPTKVNFIKANTIANKAVSTIYGHPRMLKKEQMTAKMLEQREPILDDVVNLMAANESFQLGLSISTSVYGKYSNQNVLKAN